MHKIFLLLLLPSILCARQIETFYGPLEVEEPVLLELIDSPAFQRLKHIHQYGVAYYTTHREEYSRYDHSIGVFAILRINEASLEEQIAGLLHDVSHTAFSHVGDWIFGKENQDKDYQNSIHSLFLEKRGLKAILEKHQFTVEQILPTEELFPLLENSLPNLCADRIDYNIQGACHRGFITHEEAVCIFNDLRFANNRWVSTCKELMKKLTRFSLFMTEDCWGGPTNYITSRYLADAILRGMELGCISSEEIHFGTDQVIWDKLILQKDPVIQQKMQVAMNCGTYFSLTDFSDKDLFLVKSKFRGINPWILLDSGCFRLTVIDKQLSEEYDRVKQAAKDGWPIRILQN